MQNHYEEREEPYEEPDCDQIKEMLIDLVLCGITCDAKRFLSKNSRFVLGRPIIKNNDEKLAYTTLSIAKRRNDTEMIEILSNFFTGVDIEKLKLRLEDDDA